MGYSILVFAPNLHIQINIYYIYYLENSNKKEMQQVKTHEMWVPKAGIQQSEKWEQRESDYHMGEE